MEPEVEVLLAEVVGRRPRSPLHRSSRGRHARALRARHQPPRLACASSTRSRSPRPGTERPLTKPEHFRRYVGRARPRAHARRPRRPHVVHRRAPRRDRRRGHGRRRHRRRLDRRTPTSIVPTSWETEAHVRRDRRGSQGARAREGHLRGEADGGARGRAPVGLQEAARRRPLRPRAHGPRLRRLHRRGVPAARRSSRTSCSTRPRSRPPARSSAASTRRRARSSSRRRRRSIPARLSDFEDQIETARRHAARLRPDRRADRQAGDPAADPRGRARHDVRGVPRPRRRADHRHRPAVRLPLHARAAARARRGAAAEVRAGRRRALRPLAAHQGRDQGGLLLDARPEHHRLAAATRS